MDANPKGKDAVRSLGQTDRYDVVEAVKATSCELKFIIQKCFIMSDFIENVEGIPQ